MTKQEIFDRAVAGLASQGFKRSGNGSICQYRSDDGCRKCAVGWLIPDEKYDPEFEGQAVSEYVLFDSGGQDWYERDKLKLANILAAAGIEHDRDVVAFVELLQSAHDNAYGWNDVTGEEVDKPAKMREALRTLATKHNLTIPEVLNG